MSASGAYLDAPLELLRPRGQHGQRVGPSHHPFVLVILEPRLVGVDELEPRQVAARRVKVPQVQRVQVLRARQKCTRRQQWVSSGKHPELLRV